MRVFWHLNVIIKENILTQLTVQQSRKIAFCHDLCNLQRQLNVSLKLCLPVLFHEKMCFCLKEHICNAQDLNYCLSPSSHYLCQPVTLYFKYETCAVLFNAFKEKNIQCYIVAKLIFNDQYLVFESVANMTFLYIYTRHFQI